MALAGNEQVVVTGVSPAGGSAPSSFTTTTGAIAALGGGGTQAALKVTGITANAVLGVLPTNAYILYALFRETNGNSANVSIGSTAGGSDVMSAVAVPANGTVQATAAAFAKDWFSVSAPETLYLASASWNGASVNCWLVYQVGP